MANCITGATLLYADLPSNTTGPALLALDINGLSSCGVFRYTAVDFALRAMDPFSEEVLFDTPLLTYDVP
ncbi:MAG: hypothetical protein LBH11_02860 [Propionibacteriaceae bacterium]|nr:hypothetical protein [Propionibacteriaceae bacterium]